MNTLPIEIINDILIYLNNKDFHNCLLSSKIFNIANNSTYRKSYLQRKYKIQELRLFKEIKTLADILQEKGFKGMLPCIGPYLKDEFKLKLYGEKYGENYHLFMIDLIKERTICYKYLSKFIMDNKFNDEDNLYMKEILNIYAKND